MRDVTPGSGRRTDQQIDKQKNHHSCRRRRREEDKNERDYRKRKGEREKREKKRERERERITKVVFAEAHTAVCISERTNSDASVLCIDNKHQHDTTQGSNGS